MINDLFYSVIIPLYNKENTITNTIESVLRQTYKNFELIIIDDGSTDQSLNRIQLFDDKRVNVHNKKNGGVSSARNAGITVAKGQNIAFLDADDLWEPLYLVTMKKLIEDFCEASFFGCQFSVKEGDEVSISNAVHSERGYVDDFFKAQYKAPVVSASSIIVKKKCFNEVGYFNTKYYRGEDLDMWYRLAKRFRFAFEPKPLSIYVNDSENRACNNQYRIKNHFIKLNFLSMKKYERLLYFKQLLNILLEKIRYHKFVSFIKAKY